jgi:CubicO group peptidase (beta-lactamase class C family)
MTPTTPESSGTRIPPVVGADPLDDRVHALMRGQHVPGVAVAVVRNGCVAETRAYGIANLELDAPVTTTTPFQIASSTKPIIGTLLMMLVVEGTLTLDAPIERYLPSLPPPWRPVTIRQLATHSSGLPSAIALPPTREELIETLGAQPLEYPPGTREVYGVTDSVVLQMGLEQVTGQPLQELLRKRIFVQLGMRDTRFSDTVPRGVRDIRFPDAAHGGTGPNSELSELVRGRAGIYRWQDGVQWIDNHIYPSYAYAGGGLYSSVDDLGRFYAALLGGKLLPTEARAEMWRLPEGKKSGFGLNWYVDERDVQGRLIVSHSGGPALGDICCLPDQGLCAIVLTNQKSLAPGLAGELLQTLVAAPPEPPTVTDEEPLGS